MSEAIKKIAQLIPAAVMRLASTQLFMAQSTQLEEGVGKWSGIPGGL